MRPTPCSAMSPCSAPRLGGLPMRIRTPPAAASPGARTDSSSSRRREERPQGHRAGPVDVGTAGTPGLAARARKSALGAAIYYTASLQVAGRVRMARRRANWRRSASARSAIARRSSSSTPGATISPSVEINLPQPAAKGEVVRLFAASRRLAHRQRLAIPVAAREHGGALQPRAYSPGLAPSKAMALA